MEYNSEAPLSNTPFKKKNRSSKKKGQSEYQNPYSTSSSAEASTISGSFNFPKQVSPKEKRRNVFYGMNESNFYSEINIGIQTCDLSTNSFQREFLKWNLERRSTLSKLKELVSELHENQLSFNRTNLFCKEMNVSSRNLKTNDDSAIDFFASLGAFMTDAIGGINSIAQACNVDKFMKTFGEIMENDAEHTKKIYAERSKYFTNYQNVEEIIRRYHSDTFGSTLNKISKSLKTEDMWLELKIASKGNNLSQVIEKVDDFFRQMSRIQIAKEICRSLGNYVDSNPAVLEACEATGKAIYGIVDTWGRDHDFSSDRQNNRKRNSRHHQNRSLVVSNSFSSTVNRALILRENSEIRRLREMLADEDEPQAKLEIKIREAIEELEEEFKEMKKLYENSLGIDRQYSNNTYSGCFH